MSEATPNFEGLLREALVPVDPPHDMATRLEATLTSITESAAEELESWELKAMRDPRNWVRPAVAVVAGSTAGAALVVLRARHRQRSMSGAAELRRGAESALRDVRDRTGKLLRR